MNGLQDGTEPVDEGAAWQAAGAESGAAAASAASRAQADYEAALRERDARIAALESEIAETAMTA